MQKNTDKFIFTIDEISPASCSGWYARKDGLDNGFSVAIDGRATAIVPGVPRPDVAKAGLGPEMCGFRINFDPILTAGSELIFSSLAGEVLHIEKLPAPDPSFSPFSPSYTAGNLNSRMMRMVEPFVEMDIARVRNALMENKIHGQYKQMLGSLAQKSNEELKQELIEILADMKTTIHLLCAAYLDYTRYREPDYLDRLPDFCPGITNSFAVEMNGDITGANWEDPTDNGRWLGDGEQASILLPTPGPGKYILTIDIMAERQPGDLGHFRLEIDSIPKNPENREMTCPCRLQYAFQIVPGNSPFLALHFIRNNPGLTVGHIPSLQISRLTFERQDA